ncbi:hypothetical protein OsJ_33508 [Oryza sativa Japonica Group]|uniref:AP180 N-terminal homology (ANTH) domain-containing protein n=1 Tax=Oryza sativa subsp. japonica TaxID=39947 RepID=A3CA52_ORYSJ|nr:hypothetical protein OsJ_33508 [Oryza sativa Japonica Group]
MKVFKGKIWAALGSLMDHSNSKASSAATPTAAAAPVPDRALLADIEAAVERCTAGGGGGDDERHVHEILFLVSNAPGAITFLSRRITARLEAARAPPAAGLRTSAALWASREPPHSTRHGAAARRTPAAAAAAASTPPPRTCSFLHGYSAYLEERMQWAIKQSGNLEPTRPRPPPKDRGEEQAAGAAAAEAPVVFKLAMSQRLLDLAIQLLPDNNTSATSAAARSAFGIVLRESFKVYDAFKDGLDALLRSLAAAGGGGKASRASSSAHEILKKARAQTPELKEFYHKCKKSSNVSSKSLDYPVVRVVTSAMELVMPPPVTDDEDDDGGGAATTEEAAGVAAQEASHPQPFATKLETTISTVWVEFDDGDGDGGGGDHSLQGVQSSYL